MKREKAENLFNLLGEIDDQIVAEAESFEYQSPQVIQMGRKKSRMRLITVAASVVFLAIGAFGIGFFDQFGMQSDDVALESDDAPMAEAEDSTWETDWDDEAVAEAEDTPDLDVADDLRLTAIDDREEFGLPSPDPELRINPDFNDIVLTVDLSADGRRLLGTIINHSDTSISPSHPEFEYFDGEAWRNVPTAENLAFADAGVTILPEGRNQSSLRLARYVIPEGYPLRLRQYIWPSGEEAESHLYHDLVYEFEIEN